MALSSQSSGRIAEQLEQQNAAWQDIQDFIENLDPRALLAVDESLLADIEAACSDWFSSPGGAPPRGLRG